MSAHSRVLAAIALFVAADLAHAAASSCPATAPQAWQLGQAPLSDVQVLSYPTGDKVDYSGVLPIMVPDRQAYRGGVFYQTWLMNTDAPKFTFEVLCSYKDIDRKLPVPAPGVSKCVLSTSHKRLLKFQCK